MTPQLSFTGIILAGGRGTRLNGLFPDLPKPLVNVLGQPFLYWIVQWAQTQGIVDFVFSTGYRAERIENWLKETSLLKPDEWKTYAEEVPLGTGGGVRACLPLCEKNLLVTNGDSLIVTPLQDVIEHFLACPEIDAVIIGKNVSDASRYASLEIDAKSRLVAYREKVQGKGLISAGVYLFRRSLLESFPVNQPLSMEYDIIPKLVADGANIVVHQAVENAAFIDIGTPETVALADTFIKENFKS